MYIPRGMEAEQRAREKERREGKRGESGTGRAERENEER